MSAQHRVQLRGRREPTSRRADLVSCNALFAGFTPEIELRIDEACVGAALGFVRRHNAGRLVSRASGETRCLDDAFVIVLRLESAGMWRISHLIWHRQSQAAPRPPEE